MKYLLALIFASLAVLAMANSYVVTGVILAILTLPFLFKPLGELAVFITCAAIEPIFGGNATTAVNTFCHKWLGFGV